MSDIVLPVTDQGAEGIADLIAPVIEDMGYRLVRVSLEGSPRKQQRLIIMLENPAGANVGVDECAKVSRAISATLDVEDPIQGRYMLEVSSAGIDRPLVRAHDLDAAQSKEVKVKLHTPLEGRANFRGILEGHNGTSLSVRVDQDVFEIPYTHVRRANLVLTDTLIKEAQKQAQERAKKKMKEQNAQESTEQINETETA